MDPDYCRKPLLFAVDVGNTHTVVGLFEDRQLLERWRLHTVCEATADELAALLHHFCTLSGRSLQRAGDLILACVVPPLLHSWEEVARRHLGSEALVIRPETPIGMRVRYRRPYEVGADRLANAVAAFHRYKGAVIIVDYGTATTFDCVSGQGEYLGGAIAPGIPSAAEALFRSTSRLPRIEIFSIPETPLAQDTPSAMQAGIVYGFAGLTDGIVERLRSEFPSPPRVIATGGLATVVAPHSHTIEALFPDLTLEGLAIIYQRLKEGQK
jgi:type III pantothenate kinase